MWWRVCCQNQLQVNDKIDKLSNNGEKFMFKTYPANIVVQSSAGYFLIWVLQFILSYIFSLESPNVETVLFYDETKLRMYIIFIGAVHG